jgi:flavin reductase (DIM6/NTAB) family NADH-FMN oxidoreductase RutF
MIINPRDFRRALGSFATGITVVTASSRESGMIGITANSFNSVSLDPPLVLFSLDRRAYSLAAFHSAGHFGINVLSDDQRNLSQIFATAMIDKWENVNYELWDTGCAMLTGALANFECKTQHIYDGGDHLIFVGRVEKMRWVETGDPLLYFRGSYRRIGEPHK